jgi:IS5 family transposase
VGQGDQAVECGAGNCRYNGHGEGNAYPTDSTLLERSREHLVKAARQCSLHLRQNYNREAPRLAQQVGRYAHAKQFRRMRAALRTLRSQVGRVHRDIARQLNKVSLPQRKALDDLLARAVVSWLSNARTRTSCMRCMRPKWNAMPKARPVPLTSSA